MKDVIFVLERFSNDTIGPQLILCAISNDLAGVQQLLAQQSNCSVGWQNDVTSVHGIGEKHSKDSRDRQVSATARSYPQQAEQQQGNERVTDCSDPTYSFEGLLEGGLGGSSGNSLVGGLGGGNGGSDVMANTQGREVDFQDLVTRQTPLILASQAGHTELVSCLLSCGADTEIKDKR